MFRRFAVFAPLFLAACSLAACNSSKANDEGLSQSFCVGIEGETYGEGITQTEIVPIAQIVADPMSFEGKTVRVEGLVLDVCAKRGCWFDIAGEKPGEKLRFKVDDGVMVFPVEVEGDHAVAQGVIVVEELSLEQTRERLQHHAEEVGEEFDPERVTAGETLFRLQGTGAVIGKRIEPDA